jgi:hypothetical protein
MVCTSLATLLKSPVMSGLADLAGCLVDTREDFSMLAKAFIQVTSVWFDLFGWCWCGV